VGLIKNKNKIVGPHFCLNKLCLDKFYKSWGVTIAMHMVQAVRYASWSVLSLPSIWTCCRDLLRWACLVSNPRKKQQCPLVLQQKKAKRIFPRCANHVKAICSPRPHRFHSVNQKITSPEQKIQADALGRQEWCGRCTRMDAREGNHGGALGVQWCCGRRAWMVTGAGQRRVPWRGWWH
jgi:hypothetical protein